MVILTLTFASFVQKWRDVVDNVHLLHEWNHIGMSAAVVKGTQRQKEHVSLNLERHNDKSYSACQNDHFYQTRRFILISEHNQ